MAESRHWKAVASGPLSNGGERRYVVVDDITGEILDDAQGHGYRSARNAYRGYSYKALPAATKSRRAAAKRQVHRWCAEHKSFMAAVEQEQFYALKDGDPLTTADVKGLVEQLLSEWDLKLPFPVDELLRHW